MSIGNCFQRKNTLLNRDSIDKSKSKSKSEPESESESEGYFLKA